MNSDAARSDAFTKYCIASNMSRDEVFQAAAVFASAWDAGAEYGAERAETERDAALGDAAECRAERSRYGDMMTDKLVATEAERDAARAEVARLRAEITRMSDEFADVLDTAITRGEVLGYDSDSDYIQRWEELTGDEWVEE